MAEGETKVAKFFHGYAAEFDSIYGHTKSRGLVGRWIDGTFRQTMFLRFREVLKNATKPEIRTVLDIGCGPGRYGVELAKLGKTVVGLDLAEGMLVIARRSAEEAGVAGRMSFINADYLSHDFAAKFDAAVLMGFFDYIERPLDILRRLKKDISVEFYASFPKAGGALALQRKIRYRIRGCPLYFYSEKDVRALMDLAKFSGGYDLLDFGRDYFVKAKVS